MNPVTDYLLPSLQALLAYGPRGIGQRRLRDGLVSIDRKIMLEHRCR